MTIIAYIHFFVKKSQGYYCSAPITTNQKSPKDIVNLNKITISACSKLLGKIHCFTSQKITDHRVEKMIDKIKKDQLVKVELIKINHLKQVKLIL